MVASRREIHHVPLLEIPPVVAQAMRAFPTGFVWQPETRHRNQMPHCMSEEAVRTRPGKALVARYSVSVPTIFCLAVWALRSVLIPL
jgi:hypothetical protein